MRDFSRSLDALALNTATLGHNLEGYGAGWSSQQVIDACAQRGFSAITFWRRELDNAYQTGNQVRSAGMQVSGLCRAPYLVGPLAEKPQQVLDDFHRSIECAAELGAPVLTIVVGGINAQSTMRESLSQVAQIVERMASVASQAKVKLALEPLHPVYGGNRSCLVTVRDTIDIVQQIQHPAITIALDVYHIWWDMDLETQLQRVQPGEIAGFHLCDWLADTTDVLLDRGMMGDGVADLKSIRRVVEASGYNGFCEIEIFSAANWWLQDPATVLDVCVQRFQTVC